MLHHGSFMWSSHTQATHVPIDLSRARMHHAPHERVDVANLKWNVNRIRFSNSKRSVVQVRRDRMHHWAAHQTRNFRLLVDAVYSVNFAELFRGQLPRRGGAFIVERTIRKKCAARRPKDANYYSRFTHGNRDHFAAIAAG